MSQRLPALLCILFCLGANAETLDRGVERFESGDYEAAADFFSEKDRRDLPDAQFWLGRIAMEAADYRAAEKHFERATEARPDRHEFVLWLGRAYGSRARDANVFTQGVLAPKIRDAFARAVELEPGDVESRGNLIDFYLEAPAFLGGSLDKAREQAQAIAALDPVAGIEHEARIARADRNPEAALAILVNGIEAHPHHEPLYISAAMTAQELDQWGRSVELLQQAVERIPDAWSATYQIGRAAAITGDNLERGAAALERFITSAPEDSGYPADAPHVRLAQIYEHLDQREQARRHLEAALSANPANKDAAKALRALGD